LGQAWGPQSVEPLAELLAREPSRSVRRIAAHTLSRIAGEAARQALQSLQSDPDRQVRRIAARAGERALAASPGED
jgi:HEAT repeat protein